MRTWIVTGLVVLAVGLSGVARAQDAKAGQADAKKMKKKTELATFAGGCFWCMQPPFGDIKGVKSTTVGYTGGTTKNPTYQEVCTGKTGHYESIEVEYDPSVASYSQLLDMYWHNIDPTDGDGQFCDHGMQYRPVIFYHNDEQKRLAEASMKQVEKKFGVMEVKLLPASTFYPAEEYHQNFCMKEPDRYSDYREGCGRDRRLKKLWGDQAGH